MYRQDWSPWDQSVFARPSTSRPPGPTIHNTAPNGKRFSAIHSFSTAHLNDGTQPQLNGGGPVMYRRVMATTFTREPTIGEVLRAGGRFGTVVAEKGAPAHIVSYGSSLNGNSSVLAKRVKMDLDQLDCGDTRAVAAANTRYYPPPPIFSGTTNPYYTAGNYFVAQHPYTRVANSHWPPLPHLQAAYQRKKLPNAAQRLRRSAKHSEALSKKLAASEDNKKGRPSSCARLVPFDEWRLKKERGVALGEEGYAEARSRRKKKRHSPAEDTIVLPLDAEQWTQANTRVGDEYPVSPSSFKIPPLAVARRKLEKGKEPRTLERKAGKRFSVRTGAEEAAVVEEYTKSGGLSAEEVRFLRAAWNILSLEERSRMMNGVGEKAAPPPEWVDRGLERLPSMDVKVQPIRRHYVKSYNDENFHHFRYVCDSSDGGELRDVVPLPAGCARAQSMFRPHKVVMRKRRDEWAEDAPHNSHFIRRRLNGISGIAGAAAAAPVAGAVACGSEVLDGRLVHHEIQGQSLPLTLQPPRAVVIERMRKKRVKFARSAIHGWGLFAMESIPADEVVIEYIGELVRHSVADVRERRYRAKGIGSDYMFRMDDEWVVDATRRGNYARFINHCCRPNCFGKVAAGATNGEKRITIYSKVDIEAGEELTYDYKFEAEDNEQEHVECLCGVKGCKRKLN